MKTLHWNPENMTVSDAKKAAETLYTMKTVQARMITSGGVTGFASDDELRDFALTMIQQLDGWAVAE